MLLRLVEKDVLESDASSYYRLRATAKRKKPKKWISPQIKAILDRSGKDFGELVAPEDQEDFFK